MHGVNFHNQTRYLYDTKKIPNIVTRLYVGTSRNCQTKYLDQRDYKLQSSQGNATRQFLSWQLHPFWKGCNSKDNQIYIQLTLDLRAVGRALGVPSWLMTVFCPSVSSEGKSGVPGGVRSLKNTHTHKYILHKIMNVKHAERLSFDNNNTETRK